ncbi:MAG TPA: ATP-binding cassette domain-containing protein [Cytophagaceae bacterium]
MSVTLNIPKGSVYGLLGPNGAGKSSLIRIITRITAPDEGEVLFNDEKMTVEPIARIGYLPEERGLYKKMRVDEQLLYLARLKGLSYNRAKEQLTYWTRKLEIKDWMNKKVEELSKGMQQKVQFISTVIHDPDLLILDEPFSGFDPINAAVIKQELLELKAKGKTIILSTHRMESVEELCDIIALINKGKKVLEGKVEEIRRSYRNNMYYVEGEGVLEGQENSVFNIISYCQKEGNVFEATLSTTNTANQLLAYLISKVQIRSFHEQIPTMNEIFISKVKETNE